MKCVILCAGIGERMMPLTANTPKPLLKVKGKPLLDYVLDSLPGQIDEIIIVVKYLGEQIKSHVGRNWKGTPVKYVEGSEKGNAYSFLNTRDYLKGERFLLIYGDETPTLNNVRRCLDENLSVLTYNFGIIDGVMVLNTDIFDYKPKTESFTSMLEQFMEDHKVILVEAEDFNGEFNTPNKIDG